MMPANMFSIHRKESCRMDAVSSILTMAAAGGGVLNVREASFVDEKLADAVELSVVMPEFGSALYPVLPLCIN
jgi:hypothetical protein